MDIDLATTTAHRPAGAGRSGGAAPRRPSLGHGLEHTVKAAAAGDREAWSALVARFGTRVHAVARSHRVAAHDAEDVAQTTWLRLPLALAASLRLAAWALCSALLLVLVVAAPAMAGSPSTLEAGQTLSPGSQLVSPNGQYSLFMQSSDGNLVEYGPSGAMWSSGPAGGGARAVMQTDGNLVIYNGSTLKWQSNTAGFNGARLALQDDSNLVVYDASWKAIWNRTVGYVGQRLYPGATIAPGAVLRSSNGQYSVIMQSSDGNLVEYGPSGAVWSSGPAGGGARAVMQTDGNLVIYNGSTVKWQSNTAGFNGATLTLQDDSNLVIYDASWKAIWTRNAAPVVGTPAWWNGDCDSGGYSGAYRLGAVWNGLVACGPRPGNGGRTVWFFSGAHPELEWQCVELSMRWLYQAYGVVPYSANGNDIVRNYSTNDGGGLIKITNGTAGRAPQPGDVLELLAPIHTAVVTAQSVNSSGNGSITIIQENASANGWGTLAVSGWSVAGSVSEWLHKP